MTDLFRGVDRGAMEGMLSQLGGNSAGKMLGRKTRREQIDRIESLPSGGTPIPHQARTPKKISSPRLPPMPRHPGTRYTAH